MTIYTIALYTGLAALLWTLLEFALKKSENYFISFIKNWIGTFFIFSAVVKLVDPVGFSIKMTDYFNVFNLSFLNPLAQFFAFVVLVLEFVLGIGLLFNAWKKFVYPTLLAMILFFTLLTGVSAIFGVVQDCGCFGDFLKISPWTSFIKDILLTIMVLLVVYNRKALRPYFSSVGSATVMALATLAALAFTLHNFYHLPMWDFRAYKTGTYIPEKMKEIKAPVYQNNLVYKNTTTGEEETFINTVPEGDEWEYVSMSQQLVEEGIEAPIHDFSLIDVNGQDLATQILSFEKPIALLVIHDVNKAKEKGIERLKEIIEYSNQENLYNYAFVTSSPNDELEAYKQQHGFTGTNLSGDGTMLKTMIRSNPGVILLQDGTIEAKWHYRDIPPATELLDGTVNRE